MKPSAPMTRSCRLPRCATRPTYGYRRIAALLKRERRADGMASVNTKRVYRLMKKHGYCWLGIPAGDAHAVALNLVPCFTPVESPESNGVAEPFVKIFERGFSDPLVGYLTGRILLHDPTDYPITINESLVSRIFPGRSFVHVGAVQGANMAFRQRVLLEVGGFDPLFGGGAPFEAAEDLDAAARASAMGWKGLYLPEVTVRHHHERKASDVPRLLRSYAIGLGAYHAKILLSGREFLWFAHAVYGLRYPSAWYGWAVFWQLIGGGKYTYFCIRQALWRRCRRA